MKRKLNRVCRLKNTVFFIVLGLLAVVGGLWFLRPTVSQLEKRELTPFPQFTLAGLIDGSFAKGLDQWYADTYPLREPFIRGSRQLQALYGDRSQQIILRPETADEIPSLPPSTPAPADTPAPANTPAPADTPAPAETGTPVESSLPAETGQPAVPPDSGDGAAASAPPEIEPVAPDQTQTEPADDPGSNEEPAHPDGTITTPGEVMGSIYVTGDSAYSLYYFTQITTTKYAEILNRTHQILGDGVQVYSMPIPLSSGVMLDPALLKGTGASDQKAAIDYINSQLDSGVHGLNIYDTLKEHNSEYIYFRTDHHWTALGAYYAYTEFCKAKGVEAHTLDQFEERNYEGFLGSFYAETLSDAMEKNPDTVTAYVPMGTNSMTYTTKDGTETKWSVIRNVDNYNSGAKYYCFAGSDQPLSYIHNPKITDGSSCVVIKDSFGNAFIPWLVDHYEHIYWIDFRYYWDTLPHLVKEKDIGEVIFCLNVYNTTSTNAIKLLERLVPDPS